MSVEISRLRKGSQVTTERKRTESKKEFSQSFSFARERKSQEELKALLDDIKNKGNRLVITKTYADVRAYKNLIKNYLESVLDYMYSVKKDVSFWQTQYFITRDTVDLKLEELTEAILQGEKSNLNIAASVDEIQGLVLDLYK